MLTLKENLNYGITMRYLKNRLEYLSLKITQEILALNLAYAHTWYGPTRELIARTLADFNGCAEGLSAGTIPVSYAINFVESAKNNIDQALTKFGHRLLKKQKYLSRDIKKFESVVLAIVEFKKFDPKQIMESNLKGRQEKLAELSEGVPSYPQIASVLRIEELQQKKLVDRIVKKMTKLSEMIAESGQRYDFEKSYAIQSQENLAYAHEHIAVRLDNVNPDNTHFLKGVLPKTNLKFMEKNHEKILMAVKEEVV